MYPESKISDLIQKLNSIMETEGDLEVYIDDKSFGIVPLILDEIDVMDELTSGKETKKVVVL